MNFLAHIQLSGSIEEVILGNFIADQIRGQNYLNYSPLMQQGILLHRFIDSFTDSHSIYRKSKHRLHERFGHYSGVIMDIVYDHYLTRNFHLYETTPLEMYAENFYSLLKKHQQILPSSINKMSSYMIRDNWLVQYSTLEGLEKILYQMDHRTKKRVDMAKAIEEVQKFDQDFNQEFLTFYSELSEACQKKRLEFTL